MAQRWVIGAIALAGIVTLGAAATGPALNPLAEGASVATGKAAQGSAPIAIYDLSYQERMKIGQADAVDGGGNFSTGVRPPLIKGHQIVAIDKDGNAGTPVPVE